jgi:hypothetical protein
MATSEDSNLPFYDYREIRRRVENRLGGDLSVLTHAILFLIVSVAIMNNARGMESAPGSGVWQYLPPDFKIYPQMSLWGVILVVHGVWTCLRVGLPKPIRTRVIDTEIKERLEQEDTQLLEDHRHIFHIKGFLDEDMRQRAMVALLILAVLIYIASVWIRITFYDFLRMEYFSPQATVPPVAIPIAIRFGPALIVPATLLVYWFQRNRRDQKFKQLVAAWGAAGDEVKNKHELKAKSVRLSDDGELIAVADDLPQQKASDDNSLRQSGFHSQQQNDQP